MRGPKSRGPSACQNRQSLGGAPAAPGRRLAPPDRVRRPWARVAAPAASGCAGRGYRDRRKAAKCPRARARQGARTQARRGRPRYASAPRRPCRSLGDTGGAATQRRAGVFNTHPPRATAVGARYIGGQSGAAHDQRWPAAARRAHSRAVRGTTAVRGARRGGRGCAPQPRRPRRRFSSSLGAALRATVLLTCWICCVAWLQLVNVWAEACRAGRVSEQEKTAKQRSSGPPRRARAALPRCAGRKQELRGAHRRRQRQSSDRQVLHAERMRVRGWTGPSRRPAALCRGRFSAALQR